MTILSTALIAIIGLLHTYIFFIEMFQWNTPRVNKIFNIDPALAQSTTTMAANQGLYNLFIAGGLFIGMFNDTFAYYFLGCVIVAGVYGAISVTKRIFFVQALPAIIALLVKLYIS